MDNINVAHMQVFVRYSYSDENEPFLAAYDRRSCSPSEGEEKSQVQTGAWDKPRVVERLVSAY
jgi:hypothetical protein